MNKPITLQVEEFKQKIVQLINNSKLPAFIIRPIIIDINNQLVQLEQAQYEADLKEYKEKEEKDVQD